MSDGRVRFFNSITELGEPATLIGFSKSLGLQLEVLKDTFAQDRLLEERMFTIVDAPEHLGRLACEFIEVVPPLDEKQIRRLGVLSLKQADTGRNSVSVIDNREVIPERALQNAGPIINWI